MLNFTRRVMLSSVAVISITTAIAESAKKPNVIFIKTDDQRFDALGMTGHPVTKTPFIDQLAKEGVFFERAYVTSPICGPSRANFFSGQWERKNRIGFKMISHADMSPEVFDTSWLMQLKAAGYTAGYIGKHHVSIGSGEQKNYFQESLDFCYMHPGHLGFDLSKKKVFSNLKNTTQVEGLYEATEAFLRPGPDKDYFYENADPSVKKYLKVRDTEKPFALSINFNLPHAASLGGMGQGKNDPEIYRTLYEDQVEDFPVPDGFKGEIGNLPENVFRKDELMGYYRYKDAAALRRTMVQMARANTAIDLFVGNLRAELEEMGIAENTIIVYAADNGLLLGEHGLGGKTFLYDESVHIPLIVYSPHFTEREKGQTISKLVVGQDLPATILDLCGLAVPDSYQGVSMMPLIRGEDVDWREDVFLENLFTDQGYPRMEAVQSERWKYIRHFLKDNDRKKYLPEGSIEGEEGIFEELYDTQADPGEMKNLAANPEYRAVLEEHRRRCKELVAELAE